VDLDLAAVLAAVKAYALPRKGHAEAWELRDGSFAFRILPCAVGVELVRLGSLVVNGQQFRLSLSYVANSTVSMGLPESRPLARDLLEDWVVSVPHDNFSSIRTSLQTSSCFLANQSVSHTLPLCSPMGVPQAAYNSLSRLPNVDASVPVPIMLANKVASSLGYLRHSHYSTGHHMPLPILSVHQMWHASVLGVLQVFSHSLCLLMFRRFTFNKAALFKMVDAFLILEQPQPTEWLARPFLRYTSRAVTIFSSSNATLHVFARIDAPSESTVGWAKKEHLMPTGKFELDDRRLLDLKRRQTC
jgi:hypothetical protein